MRRFLDHVKTGSLSSVGLSREQPVPARFTPLVVATLALVAFGGCAGTSAKKQELDDVRSELRAVRAENARLEKRLSRLEDEAAVLRARTSAQSPSEDTAAKSDAAQVTRVPELAVVKLEPKPRSPEVPIRAEIREPTEEDLQAALAQGDEAAQPEDGPKIDPAPEYDRGMAALRTGDVSGAVIMLQEFAQQNPHHPHADNALYFSGIGLHALGDLESASRLFERVLQDHPAGDARMEAMLKLAECRARLDRQDDARVLYQKLIQTWPGTPAASQAQQRLASLRP